MKKNSITVETINHTREILNLPKRATMDQIKDHYRTSIKKWHPDRGKETPEKCEEMSRRITEAFRVILKYCVLYQYSFERDEAEKYLSEDERWYQSFKSDPFKMHWKFSGRSKKCPG